MLRTAKGLDTSGKDRDFGDVGNGLTKGLNILNRIVAHPTLTDREDSIMLI